MYTNFTTNRYKGCINLANNDLYLSYLSPNYKRILLSKHVKYSTEDTNIDKEVHDKIKEIQ